MLQPRAAHSRYKVGKFIQCVNYHIFILQTFFVFTLGSFSAIYTGIVRTETNYFHKIFMKMVNVIYEFYIGRSFSKFRQAACGPQAVVCPPLFYFVLSMCCIAKPILFGTSVQLPLLFGTCVQLPFLYIWHFRYAALHNLSQNSNDLEKSTSNCDP